MAFKKYAAIALGCLVALAIAFAAGRFTTPTTVEVRTEFIEKVREVRLVQVQRETEVKVKRVVIVETRPDGSSTSTTREESDTHVNENSYDSSKTEKIAEAASSSKTTKDAPRWTILATAQVRPDLLVKASNTQAFTFGLVGAYRLLGPLQVGASIDTSGAVGVVAGVSF